MSTASTQRTRHRPFQPTFESERRGSGSARGTWPRAKAEICDLHRHDRSPVLKNHLDTAAFLLCGVLAVVTWQAGWWPLTVAFWLLGGHFGHIKPLMFHDASHGTLHPTPWRNELLGMLIGWAMFVPLSVYRYAHALHHAAMSTAKDPELWPFTVPGTPRWVRVPLAIVEILCGVVYTPLLFLRSVLVAEKLPPKQKRLIVLEYIATAVLWTGLLTIIHMNGWWTYFLVGYAAPVTVSGMFQTLNKYTQHMGLLGHCVLSGTRTVVDRRPAGKAFSYSIQHNDYHGTHHRYAKIPYYNLPTATPYVYQGDQPAGPIFHSYLSALWDMVKTLGDPKVGGQWLEYERKQSAERRIHAETPVADQSVRQDRVRRIDKPHAPEMPAAETRVRS